MAAARSPTWSVYDGLWDADTDAEEDAFGTGPMPFLSEPVATQTLRGSRLVKKELLSRGAQGAVYAAYDPSLPSEDSAPGSPKGTLVAVKRLFLQPSDFGARGVAESVLREATLLSFIARKQADPRCALDASARVVHLHRIVEAPHRELCLALEYCALDLRRLAISGRGGACVGHGPGAAWASAANPSDAGGRPGACEKLPMPVIKHVLRGVLRVVAFLHEECHILHRDLKLSNLLVTREGELRLSDFGSARFMKPTPRGKGGEDGAGTERRDDVGDDEGVYTPAVMRTTRLYQAPECLLGNHNSGTAMEVWSVGVMFAELLRQTHLFTGNSDLSLLSAIWKLLGPPPHRSPETTARATPTAAAAEAPRCREGAITGKSSSPLPHFGNATAGVPAQPVPTEQAPTLPLKFNETVVPSDGFDLLRRMLTILPEDRITVREALTHPFLSAQTAEEEQEAARVWKALVQEAVRAAERTVCVRMPPLPSTVQAGIRGFGGGVRMGLGLETSEEDDSDEEQEVAPPMFRLHP